MFQKRTEALEAQRRAREARPEDAQPKRVSDQELFAMPGASYRVVTVPKVN
jgi:hypothetical protein